MSGPTTSSKPAEPKRDRPKSALKPATGPKPTPVDPWADVVAFLRSKDNITTWARDDGEGDDKPCGMLFADLAAAFVGAKERAGIQSRSPRIYVRSQLIPHLSHVPAEELSTPQIASWFHCYSATRPGGANEALQLLAAVLSYGREEGILPNGTPNPCAPIRKDPR